MKKYLVANWKSNKERNTISTWLTTFQGSLISLDQAKVQVVIAPPFSLLANLHQEIGQKSKNTINQIALAVQDISPFPAGSYTGAVSITNLVGFDVEFAIVGHSERRRYFHETHQDVANKVARCVEAGITPIVCVDDEYISDQASAIAPEHIEKCIVAYEELGAIGTGHNESAAKVKSVVERIKLVFNQVPVLYGGSVNSSNIEEYISVVDGVLVGTASLDPEAFAKIVTHCLVE